MPFDPYSGKLRIVLSMDFGRPSGACSMALRYRSRSACPSASMIGGRASRRPEHIPLAQLIEQAAQFGTVPTARRCLLFEYPRASRHAQRRDLCRVVLVLGGDAGITDLHERAPYLTSVVVGPS